MEGKRNVKKVLEHFVLCALTDGWMYSRAVDVVLLNKLSNAHTRIEIISRNPYPKMYRMLTATEQILS
jgi:hypothetical protein